MIVKKRTTHTSEASVRSCYDRLLKTVDFEKMSILEAMANYCYSETEQQDSSWVLDRKKHSQLYKNATGLWYKREWPHIMDLPDACIMKILSYVGGNPVQIVNKSESMVRFAENEQGKLVVQRARLVPMVAAMYIPFEAWNAYTTCYRFNRLLQMHYVLGIQ